LMIEGINTVPLDALAAGLEGIETIDTGRIPTWPIGVQEKIAMIAQPVRLGRAIKLSNEPPRLSFVYLLLDWSTEGPSPDPAAKILLYTPDPDGPDCHQNAADHWESVATESIDQVGRAFPESQITISRASSFRSDPNFHAVLKLALRAPATAFSAIEGVEAPTGTRPTFAAPVCRECGVTAADYTYIDDWDRVQSTCAACGHGQEADIRELNYRVDRRVLDAAVTVALRPRARFLTELEFENGNPGRVTVALATASRIDETVSSVVYVVSPSAIVEPPDVDLDVEELVLLARQLELG